MKRACLFLLVAVVPCSALARPNGPEVFCDVYPGSPVCVANAANCTLCHTTPPALNAYGGALFETFEGDVPASDFEGAITQALSLVGPFDADGDGFSNEDEILWGSHPANAQEFPREIDCTEGVRLPGLDPCTYDPLYVYRRVSLDFCGRSPDYEVLLALHEDPSPLDAIHTLLDSCLDSEWWVGRDGALWKIAHKKIRPLDSLKAGEDSGDIPLGDYEDDYNLFVYSQIDGHDARDLLTAQYLVSRTDGTPTVYSAYESNPLQQLAARGLIAAQRVQVEKRAGILTSDWFVLINTMFAAMPRTTAAQAYRSFLGYDLAKLEGLYPVVDEPYDYDAKGVDDAACAICHSTLDPLTYPFTRYEGLGSAGLGYDEDRLERFVSTDGPDVVNTPESGSLFGEPVQDLVEWGEVAANSDEFARATVLDYWRLAFGEDPAGAELETFNRLWQDLRGTHQYSVEAMLHALIETEAYGVP